jgi:hypothetical protein
MKCPYTFILKLCEPLFASCVPGVFVVHCSGDCFNFVPILLEAQWQPQLGNELASSALAKTIE